MSRSKLKKLGIDLPLFPTSPAGYLPGSESWISRQEELDIDVLVEGSTVNSTVDRWRFAQNQTVRPVKAILAGPVTLMDLSLNKDRTGRRGAILGQAVKIRKEVEDLIQAGAKIIQLDEPALSINEDLRGMELSTAIEALQICMKDLPAYFIGRVGGRDPAKIYEELRTLPFDNLHVEFWNEGPDLSYPFRHQPFAKDLSVEAFDPRSRRIEDTKTVRKKIEEIAEVLPDHRGGEIWQLWISPDCGSKTHTEEEAFQRLKVARAAAEELRQRAIRYRKSA